MPWPAKKTFEIDNFALASKFQNHTHVNGDYRSQIHPSVFLRIAASSRLAASFRSQPPSVLQLPSDRSFLPIVAHNIRLPPVVAQSYHRIRFPVNFFVNSILLTNKPHMSTRPRKKEAMKKHKKVTVADEIKTIPDSEEHEQTTTPPVYEPEKIPIHENQWSKPFKWQ
ncbi:unnamed protein product [Lactuca virosa]|uniref:Uncharacterized protein n=1 Tax=Lactuca virosa TaxID=75947 RepID=A0AAU9PKW2_9ASTR|nr:unnamed protein product [Lactuca virosa]